jgi:mono/diheme cytochrome c family protein
MRRIGSESHPLRFAAALTLVVAVACGGEQRDPGQTPGVAVAAGQAGEQLYQQRCASCHQPDGRGIEGSFPPLAASEFATTADPTVPIMVVLYGMHGPVTVHGVQYSGLMPPYGMGIQMSDEEVAAVLTYVRSSWGNQASAVAPQDVARVRAAPRAGSGPVTAEELAPLM